jgi:hypothetical protein
MRIKFDAKTVARFKLPDNKKEEIYWDEELAPYLAAIRERGT